jgi:hypothetical protein
VFAKFAGIGMLALAMQNRIPGAGLTGGVYARPLGLGNLLYFSSQALTPGRSLVAEMLPVEATAVRGVPAFLAVAFVRPVLFSQATAE